MTTVDPSAWTAAAPSTLPYSREAEEAVVSALLQDADAVSEVIELLHPDDFHVRPLCVIYEALLATFDRAHSTDLTLVGEELLKRGELDRVGGPLELVRIAEKVPSSASVAAHARIVVEKAQLRRLVQAADEILARAREGADSIQALVDQAENAIFEVAQRTHTETVPLRTAISEAMSLIEQSGTGAQIGIPTYYADLDQMLGGLQPGQLIILAARPSMGKTTLALNIALRCALAARARVPVAVFSLEMTRQQLAQNLLACHARFDSQKLRRGQGEPDEWERYGAACEQLMEAPIYIDDQPGMTLLQIRAKARRARLAYGVRLIVVDYLQLVTGPRSESRQQEISQISMGLKQLSREIGTPVLAISQLNRSVDAREDHRPRMSDLRESGSLEQDADIVLFLYREDYYDLGKNPSTLGRSKLIVAKHRNGPTGEIDLTFFPHQLRFEPYSNLDYRG